MNLPIFGADAALYMSITHYRAIGSWTNEGPTYRWVCRSSERQRPCVPR